MARRQASARALAVARGEEPADALITGGHVFSAATREWVDTSLALADGVIAGWGEREALEVIDVGGAALTPGFVDAHMHLESTKLWIDEFVATVLPHGTTAVAADPHELANVLGVPGIVALIEAAAPLPFTFAVYAPSCVPASGFERSGATLDSADIRELIERHGAHGVAEVMNFPGVIAGEEEMLARIAAAGGHRRVDGHSPGVAGRALDAYLAAGVESDHESTRLEEAEEKRRKGMWVFLRQGSASQNLVDLAPTILAHGTDQAAFCTDDREPDTLRELGHVNDCARLAVEAGISEIDAIILASTNPARYHRLDHLGSLGPGHQADILCFSDLASWSPARVWQAGRLVAQDGRILPGAVPPSPPPPLLRGTVNIGELPTARALTLEAAPGTRVRAVGVASRSLTTRRRVLEIGAGDDIAYAAVVERHHATGRVGCGFATGFALKRGAIASTVAHDAHNAVVIGASGEDMAAAVARLAELGGGQVAVLDGRVIAEVALPLAGLMSDRSAEEVSEQLRALGTAAADQLGTTVEEPFMQLSFIALSVIPELRLTDGGLVDVDQVEFVAVEIA
ncbi:MAG TPA: adenine deaminase [Solirubrobacteraceae bacterium]|jgi:adenine deaminase|nr:adenine deaminase [Solirubrobacteraceae bacterium]